MPIAASNVGDGRLLVRCQRLAQVAARLEPGRQVGDEDRAADDVEPLALAEHVLGPAQADAVGAITPCLGGFLRLVGVRPDGHPGEPVGPVEDRLELRLVLEPGLDRRQRPDEDLAGRPVEADPVALLDLEAAEVRLGVLRLGVDVELGGAGNARLADLAGNDCRVGCRAATGRQDALGDRHAVEVVGRGLLADEDDLLTATDPFDGIVGGEDGLSDGGTGRGVEALGDPGRCLPGVRLELGTEQLVDLRRLDPPDCLLLRDHPLVDHVDRDLHGGRGGPLRRPGLEHVQLAALDRELEVLDVAVVALELLADPLELVVDLRHLGLPSGRSSAPSGRRPRHPRPGRS